MIQKTKRNKPSLMIFSNDGATRIFSPSKTLVSETMDFRPNFAGDMRAWMCYSANSWPVLASMRLTLKEQYLGQLEMLFGSTAAKYTQERKLCGWPYRHNCRAIQCNLFNCVIADREIQIQISIGGGGGYQHRLMIHVWTSMTLEMYNYISDEVVSWYE